MMGPVEAHAPLIEQTVKSGLCSGDAFSMGATSLVVTRIDCELDFLKICIPWYVVPVFEDGQNKAAFKGKLWLTFGATSFSSNSIRFTYTF
jgi:hypothetical protein